MKYPINIRIDCAAPFTFQYFLYLFFECSEIYFIGINAHEMCTKAPKKLFF